VKELENEGKMPLNVGLLNEPVEEDSWRLAAALEEGGGGGAEWAPVGWVKVAVKDSVGFVNEPVGAEWEPGGALCDSWENDPVGVLNIPVKLDS
jgi:hypothetical protein